MIKLMMRMMYFYDEINYEDDESLLMKTTTTLYGEYN